MRRLLVPLLLAAACHGPPAPPPGPAVVLIVLDALSASHVHHLGYERETTPNLDRLARAGITFTRCYAPAPYTLASIPSLLTGRLPDAHGVVDSDRVLAPAETTLAELLRAGGWRTFAAVANLNGSSIYGLGQGFEHFVEMFRAPGQRQRASRPAAQNPEQALARLRQRRGELHYPKAGEYVPVVTQWLAELQPDETPFFYLHLLEPHAPYQPPEPFRSRWIDPTYDGPFAGGDTETLLDDFNGRIEHDERDEEAARALYDANVAYADHVLGQLFALLDAAGRFDETLIVVTADHGEAFWEHGTWGHNFTLFDEMVRVPLIVKPPASWGSSGRVADELVSTLDVLPSVCHWTGLDLPERHLEGVPLDDVSAAARPAPAPPAGASSPAGQPNRELFLRTHHPEPDFGLVTRTAKVLLNRNLDGASGRRRLELYDLEADPGEHRPLDPAAHPAGAALLEPLHQWVRVLSARSQAARGRGPELTDEERALLRQLGYL